MTQSKKKTGKPFVIFLLCSIAAVNAFTSESPDKKGETFLDQERRQAHAKNILDRNIARRITEGDSDSVLDNLFDRRSFRTGPLDRKSGSDSARRETPLERRSINNPESMKRRDSRRLFDETRRNSELRNREDVLRLEQKDASRRETLSIRTSAPLRHRSSESSRRLNDRNDVRFDRTLTVGPSESATIGTLRSERQERSEQRERSGESTNRRLNTRNDIRFDRKQVSEPRTITNILRQERSEQREHRNENSRRLNDIPSGRTPTKQVSESRANIVRGERSEQSDENSRRQARLERKERSGERSRRFNIRNDIRLNRQASEPRTLSNILRQDRSERNDRSVENSGRLSNTNDIRFDRQASEARTLPNFLRQDRSERRERSDDDSRRQNIRSNVGSDSVRDGERSDDDSRRLTIRNRSRFGRTLSRRVSELRTTSNVLRFKRQARFERRERSNDLSMRRNSRNYLPLSRKGAEPRVNADNLRSERHERTERRERNMESSEETSRRLNNIKNRLSIDRTASRRHSEPPVLRADRRERVEGVSRLVDIINEVTFDRAEPMRASQLKRQSDETSRRLRRISLLSERRERSQERLSELSRRNSDSGRSLEEVSKRFDIRNLRESGVKLSDATFRLNTLQEREASRTSARSQKEGPVRNFRTSELRRERDTQTVERSEKDEFSRDRFLKESLSSRALPVFEAEKFSHTEVWANTVKIILAMYLIGQIFVDSKRSKFRFQNVVNTLHMKKVQ